MSTALPPYLAPAADALCRGDALSIVARGLGATVYLAAEAVRRAVNDDMRPILVLNAQHHEAALREQFARSGVDVDARLAKHRSADTGRAERKALYATGGVVLCGARAACVDLLDGTLDATRIEGILVLDAERCSESSPEAFALRLFRDRSTRGWVSAISEAPERLGGGFACLAKVVKTLTVASCALWPRFENRLADALERRPPRMTEICMKLDESGAVLQRRVVSTIAACARELKGRCAGVKGADVSYLAEALTHGASRADAFFGDLDGALQKVRQGTSWRAFPKQGRQLVGELRALGDLLDAVANDDGVACLERTRACVRAARDRPAPSNWSRSSNADALLDAALRRVVAAEKPLCLRAAAAPKLRLCRAALSGGGGTCVVVVANSSRAAHVASALSEGAAAQEHRRLLDFLKRDNQPWRRDPQKRRTVLRRAFLAEEEKRRKPETKRKLGEAARWARLHILTHAQVLDDRDPLGDVAPDRIILVDVVFEVVRRVEAYATTCRVDVFTLKLEGAADESRLRATIAQERDAFVRLIDERRLLAATSDAERRLPNGPPKKARAVICDAREFRSSLPLALYGHGLVVVPSTLTVGDYVLSSDTVVERKAVQDLHGSLQSGRLAVQAEAMAKFYRVPLLLIETTASLTGTQSYTADLQEDTSQTKWAPKEDLPSTRSVEARLAILAMAQPRLRFCWASTDQASALLFAAISRNRPEPSLDKARAAGASPNDGVDRNEAAVALVRRLPGVRDDNLRALLAGTASLAALADASLDELTPLLGKRDAGRLFAFLKRPLASVEPSARRR